MGARLEPRRVVPAAWLAVTIAGCAVFITQGVGFMRAEPAVPASLAKPSAGPVQPATPDVRAILARNAFDFTTGPLWPPPVEPEYDEEPEAEAPAAPPEPGPCEGELRVSGAAYVSPGRAVVMFSGPNVKGDGARSVGMEVAGKTVTAIYPNVVVLRDAAGLECWITLRDRPREATKSDAAAPAKAGKAAAKKKKP